MNDVERRIPNLIPGTTVLYDWRQFIVASILEDDERVVLELVSTGEAENDIAVRLDQTRSRTREAKRS